MTNINTRISEITVYTEQALITRFGKISLTGEESELVIAGIPLSIQTESVRVRSTGTADVKLLDLRIENIFDGEPLGEKITQLSRQIRQLEQQKRSIQDQLYAFQLQRNFVEGLSEKSLDRFSISLSTPQLNLDEVRDLLNFLGQQYGEYANAIAQRERQLREIDKQLEICLQQLKHLQKPLTKESYSSYSIIITIEPVIADNFELEISYLVNRVIWTPIYDLRTTSNSHELNLTYLAEIKQKTGEDWTGVKLTLSTGKPSLGILPPKLEPWYISGKKNDLFPSYNEQHREDSFEELEALLAEENAPTKNPNFLEIQQRIIPPKANSVVTFRLEQDINIPSDGAGYKLTIFTGNYLYQTQYVAIPRLMAFAYLEATVTNTFDRITLLPGKANIFRDRTFVGTTQLDRVPPSQKFNLNLGIDECLQIDRNLVEREVELTGNYRRTTYAYRLRITNLRDRKTTLKLIEQLPVSRDEKIKVRLLSTRPEIHLCKMGQLEWLLTLQPQPKRLCKRELYYQFIIEHPAEITVVSLDI